MSATSPLMTFASHRQEDTQGLAAALARRCAAGDCVALEGDLGAGKTAFARGFIHALQETKEEVASPTFALAQTYPTRHGFPIWHLDLYRLKDARDLRDIGLDEALTAGITLVEWPELARAALPPQTLTVRIEYGDGDNERRIALHGAATLWQPRLQAMEKESA